MVVLKIEVVHILRHTQFVERLWLPQLGVVLGQNQGLEPFEIIDSVIIRGGSKT